MISEYSGGGEERQFIAFEVPGFTKEDGIACLLNTIIHNSQTI